MYTMLINSCFVSLASFFKPQQLPRTNLPSSNGFLLPCYATSSNISQRKSVNYQPNIWNYDSLQSLKHEYADVHYVNRSMKLKEEVRRMINDENIEILELIENVKCLGLSYHFEKEIREALDRFMFSEKYGDKAIGENLHDTALKFRLLREYGYDVSTDIFERFKDHNGNFQKYIVKDIKGMLSLYEASVMSYEGEQILDEANSFTSFHLKRELHDDRKHFFFKKVNHSLKLPLHRRFQRLEARRYIELYGKEKNANKVLLEAAMLDFNIVQSNLQQDLIEMSRWWKKMGLASKLSFSRDRLTECFFWAVGMSYENEFSDLPKNLTKVISLITTLDDLYDVYGTLDELELFTTAVESWDIKEVQVLPKYMKILFLALYNTINELSYHVLKYHELDALPYFTKAWSDLLKSFLQEAKWCKEQELPKFEDYINNAWVSSSGVVLLVHTYFMLNHNITKQSLEALDNCHALLRSPSLIFRLCNDMVTYKAELERGERVNSIMCYMNENHVSEEVAYEYIQCLLNETWKKLNRDRVIDSPFPKAFTKSTINLARTAHCVYQNGDGHGVPDATAKNRVCSLIIEPILHMVNDAS